MSLPSNEQLNDANNKSASETLETERGSYKANSNNDNTSNIKSVDDEVLPEYEYISESGIDWITLAETTVQRCSHKKMFWKYAANLQENTHAEVWF